MLKDGPEVGGALAGELEVLHGGLQLLFIGDELIGAELVVALEEPQAEGAEKALRLLQNGIGVGEKLPHQLPGGGHGGVDGDDQVPDPAGLTGLQRLDEGHVAVAAQAVGVVAVVEGVGVHPQLLPQHGEALEEGPVVVLLPGLHLQLLQHRLTAGGVLAEHRFHAGLHPLGGPLPLLLVLLGLLLVPETVVVLEKFPGQGGPLVGGGALPAEETVDGLGGEGLVPAPQPGVEGLPPAHRHWGGEAGVVQAVQDGLHRDVAAQVPQRPVPSLPLGEVAEETVEDGVEVGSAHQGPAALIPGGKPGAAVVEGLSIGGQGWGIEAGLRPEGAQGGVQKGQVEVELIPGGKEDFLAQSLPFTAFCHGPPHRSKDLSRPCPGAGRRSSSRRARASVFPRCRAASQAAERWAGERSFWARRKESPSVSRRSSRRATASSPW